jgi:CelD/BcsL family acetyltransferase involved in cellulose biosynthesis
VCELSVSVVTDGEGFRALQDEWNDLLESDDRATVFQTWEFQYHAWRIFEDVVALRLVLVRDEQDRLIGCAPLGSRIWRMGPLSVRLLGFCALKYCDYNDFVLQTDRAPDALAALAEWFRENTGQWDVMQFQPVCEDAWVLCHELFLGRTRGRFRIERYQVAPYLSLQADWSSVEDALSNKRAKKIRYEVKRLFREFPGAFREVNQGQELECAVKQFMDLHQKRMREQHQRGRFPDSNARQGFCALAKALATQGHAKVDTISSDRETIAAHCIFEFRGTVSYFLGGFDPDYARLSPGNVALALGIANALRNTATEYDFLVGDEPYKYFWASGQRKIYRIEWLTESWRRFPYQWWTRMRGRLVKSERLRALYMLFHTSSRATAGAGTRRSLQI